MNHSEINKCQFYYKPYCFDFKFQKTNNMKLHLMLLFSMTTILSFAQKTEEATIKKLIDDESSFAAKADFTKWASCWVNSDEASFSFTNKEATHFMKTKTTTMLERKTNKINVAYCSFQMLDTLRI